MGLHGYSCLISVTAFIDDEDLDEEEASLPSPVDNKNNDDSIQTMVEAAMHCAEQLNTSLHWAVYVEPPVPAVMEPHLDNVCICVLVVSGCIFLSTTTDVLKDPRSCRMPHDMVVQYPAHIGGP